MYWFIADEHYKHEAILGFCERPFTSVQEMDAELIRRHNSVVMPGGIVIHAGDFAMTREKAVAQGYLSRLNGEHILLRGSHDRWLDSDAHEIWEKNIEGQYIVVCHYAMRVWARSHYNSWQLYGHSHGRLEPIGKQWDIGVDNNDFYPVSFEELREIMVKRPNNSNLVAQHCRR